MSNFRFNVINDAGETVFVTDWTKEQVGQGKHHALDVLMQVRKDYPGFRYRVERAGDGRIPNEVETFRYDIFIKDGQMPVLDPEAPNGIGIRAVKNGVVRTRPFRESEREKVLAEIRQLVPDARIQEVKVNG